MFRWATSAMILLVGLGARTPGTRCAWKWRAGCGAGPARSAGAAVRRGCRARGRAGESVGGPRRPPSGGRWRRRRLGHGLRTERGDSRHRDLGASACSQRGSPRIRWRAERARRGGLDHCAALRSTPAARTGALRADADHVGVPFLDHHLSRPDPGHDSAVRPDRRTRREDEADARGVLDQRAGRPGLAGTADHPDELQLGDVVALERRQAIALHTDICGRERERAERVPSLQEARRAAVSRNGAGGREGGGSRHAGREGNERGDSSQLHHVASAQLHTWPRRSFTTWPRRSFTTWPRRSFTAAPPRASPRRGALAAPLPRATEKSSPERSPRARDGPRRPSDRGA